jgi:hypothetical protein
MTNGLPPRGNTWAEPWDEIIAQCQRTPNEVGMVLESRPVSRYKTVNIKTGPPFVTDKGRLRAHRRNTHTIKGQQRVDVHLVWEQEEN